MSDLLAETVDGAAEAAPPAYEVPKGAQEVFLLMAGLAVVVLAGFVIGYGVYGKRVTSGLDAACSEAAFQAGRKYEAGGNGYKAIQKFRQAMEGRFASEEQRFMCGRAIGDLLMREGRYAEAVTAYEELPANAFATSGAYTGWVTALWRDGRGAEAESKGKTWLAMAESENNTQQQVWAHHALMRIAEDRNMLENALMHGQAMLRLDPDSDAPMHLVRVLRKMDRPGEARGYAEAYLRHGEDPKLREEAERLLPELAAAAAAKEAR